MVTARLGAPSRKANPTVEERHRARTLHTARPDERWRSGTQIRPSPCPFSRRRNSFLRLNHRSTNKAFSSSSIPATSLGQARRQPIRTHRRPPPAHAPFLTALSQTGALIDTEHSCSGGRECWIRRNAVVRQAAVAVAKAKARLPDLARDNTLCSTPHVRGSGTHGPARGDWWPRPCWSCCASPALLIGVAHDVRVRWNDECRQTMQVWRRGGLRGDA